MLVHDRSWGHDRDGRPVLLLARDPAEHARLTLAAACPAFGGSVIGLLAGGGVITAVYLSLAFLPAGPRPSWRPMLFGGLPIIGVGQHGQAGSNGCAAVGRAGSQRRERRGA